jgi:glycosyltransferase involved in cell wall biosynthesis
MSEPRLAALIPVFEGAATIAEVVRGARERVEHVLVVDDGSADESAERARAAGAEVLRHDQNSGKGAALRTGLAHLLGRGFTHAFTLDADGQHLPREMPVLLAELERHPGAILLGSRRRAPEDEVAGRNRFGNAFADWWVALAAGRELSDTQSGFRIYPIAAVLDLGTQADRYAFESEVLILASLRGMEVVSREIDVYNPPPAERVSHYDPWVDTVRIIFTVVPSRFPSPTRR